MWRASGRSTATPICGRWFGRPNKSRIKQPYQVYKGLRLTIPAHPTVQEVSEALSYSKNNDAEGMRPATNR